ncbi:asparagine-rich protein, putative [Pediculus humanus corporis]|uniref:Asparagine-rich protein, putative n=1 Tax=Pediculus humanus subsp. corporis TaxID=121224 RepID=E0VNJ1_PEDHC|nr:asparagine-rich protein, putative [Pediculus humanus corporis]EEB14947.1 asparagine-rich protein, putative [Pediculus humanus corporis]
MDPRRVKFHFNDSTSMNVHYNNLFYKNNYNDPTSKYSFYKSYNIRHKEKFNGINKNYIGKRKNDFSQPGLKKRTYKKSRNNVSSKIIPPTIEEVDEEARRKEISDVARKLLKKINVENSKSEISMSGNDDKFKSSSLIDVDKNENKCVDGVNCVKKVGGISSVMMVNGCESGRKRIAHSKNSNKLCSLKKTLPKSNHFDEESSNSSNDYNVNKEAVKDFQNRIQHKLINEIVQMPKEYLYNMLNNPNINPIMQNKISNLVKQNRLLIAQKLRAMAETKMKTNNCSTSIELLADIDKMIDPVVETDLSALPIKLIKQMEDIFQVQFDHSNNSETYLLNQNNHALNTDECVNESNNIINSKLVDCISMKEECTDAKKITDIEDYADDGKCESITTFDFKIKEEVMEDKIKLNIDGTNSESHIENQYDSNNTNSYFKRSKKPISRVIEMENIKKSTNNFHLTDISLPFPPNEIIDSTMEEEKKKMDSKSCQTDANTTEMASKETQTILDMNNVISLNDIIEDENLDSIDSHSLLQEINTIQKTINKLNVKKLNLFLKLSGVDVTNRNKIDIIN